MGGCTASIAGCGGGGRRQRGVTCYRQRGQYAGQHFPLTAKTREFIDLESGLLQSAPHESSRSERGEGALRASKSCHGLKHPLAPHRRVLGRGEAIKKPCVHLTGQIGVHCWQQGVDLAVPKV